MKKWEYKHFVQKINLYRNPTKETEEILNLLGEQGWEVIRLDEIVIENLSEVALEITAKREKEEI